MPTVRTARPGPPADRETIVELVTAAQAGDADAFGELYRIYSPGVFRYVYYRVSQYDLAEDLASETFVRALRRIRTFVWRGKDFGAWLVTIAHNLIADHFKCSRVRLEISVGVMLDSDRLEPSTEDLVVAAMVNSALYEAIGQLSDLQRRCVFLRFICGLNVAETSDAMGKNDGATKTLQYRAVRNLSKGFGGNRDLALAGAR